MEELLVKAHSNCVSGNYSSFIFFRQICVQMANDNSVKEKIKMGNSPLPVSTKTIKQKQKKYRPHTVIL